MNHRASFFYLGFMCLAAFLAVVSTPNRPTGKPLPGPLVNLRYQLIEIPKPHDELVASASLLDDGSVIFGTWKPYQESADKFWFWERAHPETLQPLKSELFYEPLMAAPNAQTMKKLVEDGSDLPFLQEVCLSPSAPLFGRYANNAVFWMRLRAPGHGYFAYFLYGPGKVLRTDENGNIWRLNGRRWTEDAKEHSAREIDGIASTGRVLFEAPDFRKSAPIIWRVGDGYQPVEALTGSDTTQYRDLQINEAGIIGGYVYDVSKRGRAIYSDVFVFSGQTGFRRLPKQRLRESGFSDLVLLCGIDSAQRVVVNVRKRGEAWFEDRIVVFAGGEQWAEVPELPHKPDWLSDSDLNRLQRLADAVDHDDTKRLPHEHHTFGFDPRWLGIEARSVNNNGMILAWGGYYLGAGVPVHERFDYRHYLLLPAAPVGR